MKKENYIRSIEKAFLICDIIVESEQDLSITQLSKLADMPIATISRYLNTLAVLGYVQQNHFTKKYHLTYKFLHLSCKVLETMELRKRITPYMIDISKDFNVSVQCAILDSFDKVVYVERLRSKNLVNISVSYQLRFSPHSLALGKVLLAFIGEKESLRIINKVKLEQLTPYTITDKKILFDELEQIRKQGYAISNGEAAEGLYGLAVPLFKNGKVEAALGVSQLLDFRKDPSFQSLLDKIRKVSKKGSL